MPSSQTTADAVVKVLRSGVAPALAHRVSLLEVMTFVVALQDELAKASTTDEQKVTS